MKGIPKALLIPYNSQGEIFLQDRAGHKPPPWGFFGGGIDEGETAAGAVIRESKEELDLDLTSSDLTFLGEVDADFYGKHVSRTFFLYKTDQTSFTVLEGRGGKWLSRKAAREKLDTAERFDAIMELVDKYI